MKILPSFSGPLANAAVTGQAPDIAGVPEIRPAEPARRGLFPSGFFPANINFLPGREGLVRIVWEVVRGR